jgi:hypothetical protein
MSTAWKSDVLPLPMVYGLNDPSHLLIEGAQATMAETQLREGAGDGFTMVPSRQFVLFMGAYHYASEGWPHGRRSSSGSVESHGSLQSWLL